mmetsp:Transcript_18094/g.45366  ORF Transcript_18094/g.45366 Transcript_18094/m.45366 type:complete len:207 (-) Transcript_18094:315-935(-)
MHRVRPLRPVLGAPSGFFSASGEPVGSEVNREDRERHHDPRQVVAERRRRREALEADPHFVQLQQEHHPHARDDLLHFRWPRDLHRGEHRERLEGLHRHPDEGSGEDRGRSLAGNLVPHRDHVHHREYDAREQKQQHHGEEPVVKDEFPQRFVGAGAARLAVVTGGRGALATGKPAVEVAAGVVAAGAASDQRVGKDLLHRDAAGR